jgi:[acyl-carrier-protein] S-malonyltransferase
MKRIGLLFSGQGAQSIGMGRDLAGYFPFVNELYDKADQILGFDLKKTSFEGPVEKLTGTDYCQPALFVHGLALLESLKSVCVGFKFESTAGLSLGEFTAHAAAQTFSFEDGLKLVAERGRLMQEACNATSGGMISLIGATNDQAAAVAHEAGIDVANYNCPGQIVLSGPKDLIQKVPEIAQKHGIKKAILLNVAGAYHSRLMQSAQDQLAPWLQKTVIKKSPVTVMSNVMGGPVSDETQIREALLKQVTGSVRWDACVQAMIQEGMDILVELGPGKILQGLCKRIDKNILCLSIGSLEDLQQLEKGQFHEFK